MTNIYGACGSCVAGKNSTLSHGSPSSNPPPSLPGGLIHADLLTLGDHSTILHTKDDHSGYLHAVKLQCGKAKASLADGWEVVRRHYDSYGWKLVHIITDSEEAFKVSHGPLQDRGIFCSVSPPEKNIGRSWQTLMKRVKVVIDSLPYVLRSSPQYSPLQFACDLLNSVPNSKFPFSSPHIIHQGVHNGYNHCPHGIPLPFGTKVSTYKLEFLSVLSLPPPALTASFTHASMVNLATQFSLEQPPSLISSHHPHHHGNLLLVSPPSPSLLVSSSLPRPFTSHYPTTS